MTTIALPFGSELSKFGSVGLSLNQKYRFYDQLGQLLRAGKTLPAALEMLAGNSSGAMLAFQRKLQAALAAGETVEESFAKQRAAIGALEISMLAAGARSGRLAEICISLSNYFRSLAKAREVIWTKSAYPLFVFHFGVIALGLPALLVGNRMGEFLIQTGTTLAVVYAIAFLLFWTASTLLAIAETNPAIDRMLLAIPGVGALRRCFALARFFATYDAQLEAGVSVLESLKSAAAASRSGALAEGMALQMQAVRQGAQVGEILQRIPIFPEWVVRAFCVAEESGGLDKELPRIALDLEEQALGRVTTLSEWLPRLIYLAVVLFIGWKVVSVFQNITHEYEKVLSF